MGHALTAAGSWKTLLTVQSAGRTGGPGIGLLIQNRESGRSTVVRQEAERARLPFDGAATPWSPQLRGPADWEASPSPRAGHLILGSGLSNGSQRRHIVVFPGSFPVAPVAETTWGSYT